MQTAFAVEPEHKQQPRPELVTSPAAVSFVPEQLLLRMLEVVRDRVEAVHEGQRALTAEVLGIKASLPMQRRPASKRTEEIHIKATWAKRNGLCPNCQETPVVSATGRLEGSELDHWHSRNVARVTAVWIVCRACNARLCDPDFKAASRSNFEAYQAAVRPLLSGRQAPLCLSGPGLTVS